jgi:hypothetical protein
LFCPECGVEYRRGFCRCAYCGVDLVPMPPNPPPESRFVTALESGDSYLVARARRALERLGVPYVVLGDESLEESGQPDRGMSLSHTMDPVAIQVPGVFMCRVKEVLEGLARR